MYKFFTYETQFYGIKNTSVKLLFTNNNYKRYKYYFINIYLNIIQINIYMIHNDCIMLIMNCKKYNKKAKFQKMTWLPQIPSYLQYYHVIGEPELEKKYKFDNENKILWIQVKDDYNSLPKKVIRAYQAIYETFEFKYIYKTDDDQILVDIKFLDILKGLITLTPQIHYGGYIVDVKQNHLSQYHKIHPELPENLPILKTKYCSGRFYFLSNQAVKDLISKKNLIETEFFEDYAIGLYLDSQYKSNMLNLMTNKFFTDIELSDFPNMVKEGKI